MVRECLRKLDPIGTALCWRSVIHCRKYSVPFSNAKWHKDGSHKLVRWKLVVHMCVDGYSWLIVYTHCPDNNHAETVLDQFTEGVDRYELPSRVRSEHGMENFGVVQYKLERRENFGVAQYKLERRENFGVAQYKLERRENFGVAQYKRERRELNRESIITGSSVHNSRVEFEIAHRDVYSGVLCFFSRTFTAAGRFWDFRSIT